MSSTPEASAMQSETHKNRRRAGRTSGEGILLDAKPTPDLLTPDQPVPDQAISGQTAPEPLNEARADASIEALIFSSDRPLPEGRIVQALEQGGLDAGGIDAAGVRASIARLNEAYETGGRAFRIELLAGGYRVMTLPEHAPVVGAMQRSSASKSLSKPALETLAIIAYRQPITRADLEAIRGVSCGETLKSLLERRLIAITGRAEVLGRPMLYGTTRAFLDAFALRSIKDLPQAQELSPKA